MLKENYLKELNDLEKTKLDKLNEWVDLVRWYCQFDNFSSTKSHSFDNIQMDWHILNTEIGIRLANKGDHHPGMKQENEKCKPKNTKKSKTVQNFVLPIVFFCKLKLVYFYIWFFVYKRESCARQCSSAHRPVAIWSITDFT